MINGAMAITLTLALSLAAIGCSTNNGATERAASAAVGQPAQWVPSDRTPRKMPAESAGIAAGPGTQTVAAGSANKATELRVDGYEIAPTFDGKTAPTGRQFVIVSARWHNILAPAQVSE